MEMQMKWSTIVLVVWFMMMMTLSVLWWSTLAFTASEFHASFGGHSWLVILNIRGDNDNKKQGSEGAHCLVILLHQLTTGMKVAQICLQNKECWALAEEERCWTVVRPERYSTSTQCKAQQCCSSFAFTFADVVILVHSMLRMVSLDMTKQNKWTLQGVWRVQPWWTSRFIKLSMRAVRRKNGWWVNGFLQGSGGHRVLRERMDDGDTQCELEDHIDNIARESTDTAAHWVDQLCLQRRKPAIVYKQTSTKLIKWIYLNAMLCCNNENNAMHLDQTYLVSWLQKPQQS
jgi:hypothetical protein